MIYKLPLPIGRVKWGVAHGGWRFEIYRTRQDAAEALAFFRRCMPA